MYIYNREQERYALFRSVRLHPLLEEIWSKYYLSFINRDDASI